MHLDCRVSIEVSYSLIGLFEALRVTIRVSNYIPILRIRHTITFAHGKPRRTECRSFVFRLLSGSSPSILLDSPLLSFSVSPISFLSTIQSNEKNHKRAVKYLHLCTRSNRKRFCFLLFTKHSRTLVQPIIEYWSRNSVGGGRG